MTGAMRSLSWRGLSMGAMAETGFSRRGWCALPAGPRSKGGPSSSVLPPPPPTAKPFLAASTSSLSPRRLPPPPHLRADAPQIAEAPRRTRYQPRSRAVRPSRVGG